MPGDSAIDFRETFAANVGSPFHRDVHLAAPPELARDNFLRAPPHPLAQVPAVNSQIVAVPVDPAHDDMNVRIVGVVVIHRGPDKAAPGVLFDLAHELPGEFR